MVAGSSSSQAFTSSTGNGADVNQVNRSPSATLSVLQPLVEGGSSWKPPAVPEPTISYTAFKEPVVPQPLTDVEVESVDPPAVSDSSTK
jgi:hypothetical protein